MPEIGKTAEKRLQPRYTLHLTGSAEVLYRRTPGAGAGTPEDALGGRFKVETVNVSLGGFMLSFDTEISATDILMLYFNHPETRAEIRIETQIQWMKRNTANIMGRYVAGVASRQHDDPGVVGLVEYALKQDPAVL